MSTVIEQAVEALDATRKELARWVAYYRDGVGIMPQREKAVDIIGQGLIVSGRLRRALRADVGAASRGADTMSSAEEYREMAWKLQVAEMYCGADGHRVFATYEVAAALREAANLREWMQLIYNFDDGAWAAGKYREAARKQGITTMRGMAGRALRGESVGDILGTNGGGE